MRESPVPPAMNDFFEAVRRASTPRIWSRGVELARAGVIHGEREDEEEIAVRVVADGVRPALAQPEWPVPNGTRAG